jgi:hypothetical protein
MLNIAKQNYCKTTVRIKILFLYIVFCRSNATRTCNKDYANTSCMNFYEHFYSHLAQLSDTYVSICPLTSIHWCGTVGPAASAHQKLGNKHILNDLHQFYQHFSHSALLFDCY